jgi:hypothetical protein
MYDTEEQTIAVPWEVLPPGEHPFSKILSYFEQLKSTGYITAYDIERLQKIYSLKPTKILRGRKSHADDFRGYIIFYFRESRLAVLDSPLIGNAIYAIKEDWEELSKLSKAELLRYHPTKVTRIIHSGNWFTRLKQVLNMP